jgi:ATP-dependent Clp protease, protease subunit
MTMMPRILDPNANVRAQDVFTLLLERREIWVVGEIADETAIPWAAMIQYLAHKDPKADIKMMINSPGGSISAGMALYDMMQNVSCPVQTVCMGMAASFGAVLLAAGAKGKRFVAPNARVLIHQVVGGVEGQQKDVEIQARDMMRIKDQINAILAKHTGQPIAKIEKDTDRDYFMTAEEAKKYGLVDKIIQ